MEYFKNGLKNFSTFFDEWIRAPFRKQQIFSNSCDNYVDHRVYT